MYFHEKILCLIYKCNVILKRKLLNIIELVFLLVWRSNCIISSLAIKPLYTQQYFKSTFIYAVFHFRILVKMIVVSINLVNKKPGMKYAYKK